MNAKSGRLYCVFVWVAGNLLASQILVGLQGFDEEIRVWIADRLFRTRTDHSVSAPSRDQYLKASTSEAALWLHDQALRHTAPMPDNALRGVETRRRRGRSAHEGGRRPVTFRVLAAIVFKAGLRSRNVRPTCAPCAG